jgi:hypothetical protein
MNLPSSQTPIMDKESGKALPVIRPHELRGRTDTGHPRTGDPRAPARPQRAKKTIVPHDVRQHENSSASIRVKIVASL